MVKIDSRTLLDSLHYANIDPNSKLIVKRYPVRDVKGTAKIILKFKPVNK